MEKTNRKLGLEETLNRLFKKAKSEPIEEDDINTDDIDLDEEDFDDEEDKEIEEDNDETIEYDFDDEEDKEIEKAEEDEIADEVDEEEEIEEEPSDDDEDIEELDYEELVTRIKDDLGVQELSAQVDDLQDNLKRVVDLLEINTDTNIANNEKNLELEKSIDTLTRKLSKFSRMRKSVKNARINDKYGDTKKSINDLSKSQRASILSDAYLAGNRNVTSLDVTRAEQGAPLSAECIKIIERHIR